MIFLKLVRYFKGYVRFSIEGDFPERLINQLSANHLSVWNVVRKKERIEACIIAKEYKKIPRLRKKNKVKTKVNGKFGFPFLYLSHKNRKGLLVGAVLFFAVLYLLSTRIWYVKVTGNEYIKTQKILSVAKECGIYEGMSNKNINSTKLKSELGNRLRETSRIAVNVEYSRITLEISEKIKTPSLPKKTPCNLVASTDGVITKLLVTKGKKAVRVNQAVQKGELLVSGTMEYKEGNTEFQHATGKIMAKTEKKIRVKQPLKFTEYHFTGEETEKSVLEFFGLKIPLFVGEVEGEYIKETETDIIKNDEFVLPLKLHSAEFRMRKPVKIEINSTRAKILAQEKIAKKEKELLKNCEVVDCKTEIKEKNGAVYIIKSFVCIENIAKEEKIIINTSKN